LKHVFVNQSKVIKLLSEDNLRDITQQVVPVQGYLQTACISNHRLQCFTTEN